MVNEYAQPKGPGAGDVPRPFRRSDPVRFMAKDENRYNDIYKKGPQGSTREVSGMSICQSHPHALATIAEDRNSVTSSGSNL